MSAHVQAVVALHSQWKINPTVDQVIAERRLNEEYCIQLARCMLSATKTSPEMKEIALSSEFSSCLREEEGEAK